MDAPPMDDLGWYEARGQVYYPREATAAAAPILSHLPGPSWPPAPALGHSTQLAPVPFPAPSSSHLPYLPYSLSPDPCSTSARSQVCDVYDPYDLQSRYDGYDPRYAHRHLAPDPGFHGMVASGVGEGQGFYAREAIRQFGMDPLAFEDALGRSPSSLVHQNRAAHHHGSAAMKKRKNMKITKTVQSAYCEVCKVDCNSLEVFSCHRAGKRHKKNLEKLSEPLRPKPSKAPPVSPPQKESPVGEDDKASVDSMKRRPAPATGQDLEAKKRRLLEEGTTAESMKVCTLCNIVCNSEIVYGYHIAGQKHSSMLKKLATSVN